MRRMACVDLPALPLQLALRRHPEWRSHPVAVVDCDKPQGRILWVSESARAASILPGLRYAAALSLVGSLRATEVPAEEIDRAVRALATRLRGLTPAVEPAKEDPGVFWLDASGLEGLYRSPAVWAEEIRSLLARTECIRSTVVVGFRRFATYAVAKASRGITVFDDPDAEGEAMRKVPLDKLALEPAVRDVLAKLGVLTVGEFAALPPDGIRRRFGKRTWELYREATGEVTIPFEPEHSESPLRGEVHLDGPESDLLRLRVVIARALQPLLGELDERDRGVVEVRVDLVFDDASRRTERLRPAQPTTDLLQLSELIHLRLARAKFTAGVIDFAIAIRSTRIGRRQLELFEEAPRRDGFAADRALARIRAEFGVDAVVKAVLQPRHLPEALFAWAPLEHVAAPEPRYVEHGALIRRIYTPPLVLPARPRHEPDGWMLRGLDQGPVVRVSGPFLVSGGWWHRAVYREYHFAETKSGEILWVFYDRFRRRWLVHGRVE